MPARKSTTSSTAMAVKGQLVELLGQARSLAAAELPPILAGSHTATIERKVRQFYISIEGTETHCRQRAPTTLWPRVLLRTLVPDFNRRRRERLRWPR